MSEAESGFRKTGDKDVTCDHAEQNASVTADPTDSEELVVSSAASFGENTVAPGMRVPIPMLSREGFGMRMMQFGEGVHVPLHKTGKRVIVQVFEGTIELQANENKWLLQPGGIAYLPKGADHSFRSMNGRARLIVTMID